jgi:hypothetical protein
MDFTITYVPKTSSKKVDRSSYAKASQEILVFINKNKFMFRYFVYSWMMTAVHVRRRPNKSPNEY